MNDPLEHIGFRASQRMLKHFQSTHMLSHIHVVNSAIKKTESEIEFIVSYWFHTN